MADLEQEVFDSGASEAPPPDIAPPSPQPSVSPPSQDSQSLTSAIDALRGPVPQYGTQPQPSPPPQPPPHPDDEPVKAGVLRDLLNERAERQRLQAALRDFQAREQERTKQAAQPKAEDLIFQDPQAYDRMIDQRIEQKTAHIRLESDMQMAAMRHGQVFDAAWQTFNQACQNGADPVSYFRVMNSRSPGEEMVRWFNEQRIMTATRGDLDGFVRYILTRAQSEPEFVSQVLGGMPPPQPQGNGNGGPPRGEDGRFVSQPQQQPRHEVRLPPSLSKMNGASRGQSFDADDDGSEEAIFDAGRTRAK